MTHWSWSMIRTRWIMGRTGGALTSIAPFWPGRIDILTGTLGKALEEPAALYRGRREIVELFPSVRAPICSRTLSPEHRRRSL